MMDITSAGKSVTLQDIANRCGVSKWTVSAALNGYSRVSQETIDRVKRMAAEMGYDPTEHLAARRLALHKHGRAVINNLIALLLPAYFHHGNDYIMLMFRGILDVLTAQRFGLLMAYHSGSFHELTLPPGITRGDVDGVITFGDLAGDAPGVLRNHAATRSLPVLSLITRVPGGSSVLANYAQGGYLATRHLLELGHRQLLVFHPAGQEMALDEPTARAGGVLLALRERGLEPARCLHGLLPSPRWYDPQSLCELIQGLISPEERAARRLLLSYLAEHPEVTAIFAHNDPGAIHTWYTLRAAGYRVPEDISLIGFDDTDPLLDADGRNCLTTIRTPLLEIGHEAAKLMIHRVTGQQPAEKDIILDTELIVRATTAPPPQAAGA